MFTSVESPKVLKKACHHFSVEFMSEGYHDGLFAEYGVPFPATLGKAIDKRRLDFLAGRFCVKQALKSIGYDPFFEVRSLEDRSPVWPEGFIGSITHTRGFASAVIASGNELFGVGIDTEILIREDTVEKIWKTILSDAETFTFSAYSAEISKAGLLTLSFSAKESIYKCFYPRVKKFFGFNGVELIDIRFDDRSFVYRMTSSFPDPVFKNYENKGYFEISGHYYHTGVEVLRQ
ncbi:MAG: 4'-phosphopantetheinyl transferase superfamily protein [Oligoflexales bacterium]|nr:4'-phosphopantetheinyl transferase superfamily protein [Oligoflexales bacterium]